MEQALEHILSTIDPVYLFVFMLTSYMAIQSFNFKWSDKYTVLFIGIILGGGFWGIYHVTGLPWYSSVFPYSAVIFITFILGQFLAKYGVVKIIEKVIKLINQKLENMFS